MTHLLGVWLGATLALFAIGGVVAGAGFAVISVLPHTVPLANAVALVLVSMVAAVLAGALLERLMRPRP